jgi:hypothetical protein
MTRQDFYILFLFALQIYIFLNRSSVGAYSIENLIASAKIHHIITFVIHFLLFVVIFINMINLLLAYKTNHQEASRLYTVFAFGGTILFFMLSYIFDIALVIAGRQ